jgi:hypothetical protein
MLKETVYTSLGAAALAADFVTSPRRQINWLKKAERRGGKLAQTSRLQVRPYRRRLEKALNDVRSTAFGVIGLAEDKTEKATKKARSSARRTVASARRSTPRVTASTRRTGTRRSGARRGVRKTTVSVVSPTSQVG